MKKIFRILSLLVPFAAISGSVMACSGPGLLTPTLNKDTIIRLGLRAEDFSMWEPVMELFNKRMEELHEQDADAYPIKYKVTEKMVSNEKADYTIDVPDLSIIDPNTAGDVIKDDKWFQPIDYDEFLGPQNHDKYKMFDDQKPFNFKKSTPKAQDGDEFFESSFIPYQKNDKVVGIPYQYGPGVILINFNYVDPTKDIKAYVPKRMGISKPIDGKLELIPLNLVQNYKCSPEDIKKFIGESGNKNNANNDIGTNAETKGSWLGFGPGNMYQRIASAAKSCTEGKLTPSMNAWSKDISFPFDLAATTPPINNEKIFKNGMIDDDILTKWYNEIGQIKPEALSYLYNSLYGYFDKTLAVDPKTLGQPGEAELMWKQKSVFLLGKKWSEPLIKKNWEDKSTNPDTSLISLPVPYGSANMDGLGISKGVTEENRLKAIKMLLKLSLSMHKIGNNPIMYDIVRAKVDYPNDPLKIKAIPTNLSAANYVKNLGAASTMTILEKSNYVAPFDMGKKYVDANSSFVQESDFYPDANNGVGGFFAASSTKGYYQIMADKASDELEKLDAAKNSNKLINSFISEVNTALSVAVKNAHAEFKMSE